MKTLFTSCVLFVTVFFASFLQAQPSETRLLRFPTIHKQQVIFSYAGDLYSYDLTKPNVSARRLTSDDGYEMFAKISPDGKWVAFTAQYDGNTEVYVMPSQGGIPKRLTYTATLHRDDVADRMGPNNIVMAWTPDSKYIVYRSRKQSFNSFTGQLYKVSVKGGLSEEIPLITGGFSSFSPDGKKLAFNQVFREFRTWKYYKGGMADDIRIFDFTTHTVTKITNTVNQEIFPMWSTNGKIYFCSDRDRTMNLFAYDLASKKTEKVTGFTNYDIKFPSINGDMIVFENAGYLYTYNTTTGKQTQLHIRIANDERWARPQLKDAAKSIRTASLSPNGNRVLFGARGDLFDVPAKEGITYNLTRTSNIHERHMHWSPDGKWIAYLSNATGEFEIYIAKADRTGKPIPLTSGTNTYIFDIKWSPDSKKIAFSDKEMNLKYIDIDTKKITTIAHSKLWEMRDFNWAPDSKWIAYVKQNNSHLRQIFLYSLAKKTTTTVTTKWFNSYNPSFSPDGKYLVFASQRTFDPIYSETEWNTAYIDMSKIYLIPLLKTTLSPLAAKNDSLKTENSKSNSSKKEAKKDNTAGNQITVKIDLDGLSQRIVELPVKAGNYWNIYAAKGAVYYNEYHHNGKFAFKYFDLKKQKEVLLGNGFNYIPSSNGTKFLVMKNKSFYVVKRPTAKINLSDAKAVPTGDMKVMVDLHQEWKELYDETWRQMKDFFYQANMHGLDWKAMHDKYAVLLPYVNHRKDLTYLQGELIGELSIGHAYVGGGDVPNLKKIYTGLLGAKFEKDKSGYFKITEILQGENWNSEHRSPLTDESVNAHKGDYILAINGIDTKQVDDIYKLLVAKANTLIDITISKTPDGKGKHIAIVKPLADEASLYYFNWVQNNIKKVDKLSNGQIGYIHIPDMVTEGLNEFVRYFYPQLDKRALIIDDRGNGGGNVSPMIIERLRRALTRANMSRNEETPTYTPEQAFVGPKVLLINQYSASDGDLFPYGFKHHKLGKVIGVRSWGGVVGIRGPLPTIDGGYLYKPEFASYSAEKSEWIIEGHGVDPDIVVENDPYKEYMGEDAQLKKAVEVLLQELKNMPKNKVPPIPPAPDKSH